MKVYNISKVSATIGAFAIGKNRPEGEAFASIEKLKEDYTFVVGSDGEMVRVPTNDNSFRVTLRLMQTSPDNGIMSTIREAGLAAANGVDIFPVVIRDGSGLSVFLAPEGFIEKAPSIGFAQNIQVVEWPIVCNKGRLYIGGN